MIVFTLIASSKFLGEKVTLKGKDLKFTPLNNNSKFEFSICPVALAITLLGLTLPPRAFIA